MKLLKNTNKIAVILPYKEIYSENFSGAASIWVKDYFNKSIYDLELHEIAFLAALPKAPNNYNPKKNYKNYQKFKKIL